MLKCGIRRIFRRSQVSSRGIFSAFGSSPRWDSLHVFVSHPLHRAHTGWVKDCENVIKHSLATLEESSTMRFLPFFFFDWQLNSSLQLNSSKERKFKQKCLSKALTANQKEMGWRKERKTEWKTHFHFLLVDISARRAENGKINCSFSLSSLMFMWVELHIFPILSSLTAASSCLLKLIVRIVNRRGGEGGTGELNLRFKTTVWFVRVSRKEFIRRLEIPLLNRGEDYWKFVRKAGGEVKFGWSRRGWWGVMRWKIFQVFFSLFLSSLNWMVKLKEISFSFFSLSSPSRSKENRNHLRIIIIIESISIFLSLV